MRDNWRVYQGNGATTPDGPALVVPAVDLRALDHPSGYRAEEGLRDAVNVALALSQPLLVTGDPGTGKTQLAHSVAYELGLRLLVFHTTTTATARDLFYRYDALRRFNDRMTEEKTLPIDAYLEYAALGEAIIRATPAESRPAGLPQRLLGEPPSRSVVLIDEIDKAPRDLPNDILHEVESLSFTVAEADGYEFAALTKWRPILILTSNSEKNLPDPFLRRCVFYHLNFPDKQRLRDIVATRVAPGSVAGDMKDLVEQAIAQFEAIRNEPLQRQPATAEFLGWLRVLWQQNIGADSMSLGQADALRITCSILSKNKEDAERLKAFLESRARRT
jgi:MoxR-like ATPase